MNIRTCSVVAALLGALAVGAVAQSESARADEILIENLDTGARSKIRAAEITSESWSEVKYRERPKAREQSVPSITVLKITRSERSKDVQTLSRGLADLSRGNYREALVAFQNVAGGGFRNDAATGNPVYTSFDADTDSKKKRRPKWTNEYAHYHYAKALLEIAKSDKDVQKFDQVLMALVDRKLEPIEDEKGKKIKRSTGGFLDRFKGGNSRFYPHALLAKAEAHVGMGEYDKAQATYDELAAAASSAPLRPEWLYEAMIGKGVIAEAKGSTRDAELAFDNAGAIMLNRLKKERREAMLNEYGKMYSRARTRVAGARLKDAEKRGSKQAFVELRAYIESGSPDALRSKYKSLNTKALKALISGVRDPEAQAVALNGTGLAYFAEKKYEKALMAFEAVAVKYYGGDPDQTSRAYYYLAKSADQAAKATKKAEAKTMYEGIKEEARKVLKTQFRESRWAKK